MREAQGTEWRPIYKNESIDSIKNKDAKPTVTKSPGANTPKGVMSPKSVQSSKVQVQ